MRHFTFVFPLLFALSCAGGEAVEDLGPPPADGVRGEEAAAEPALVESAPSAAPAALPGTAFLPPPLRPTDAALADDDALLGALRALEAGDARLAALSLDRARRDRGGHPELTALQAWALLTDGQPLDAVALSRPLAATGARAAQYVLARALVAAGRPADAHEWFERSRRAGEGSAGFHPWALEAALEADAPEVVLRELEPQLLAGPLPAADALLLARALVRADRTEDGVAQYDQLLRGAAAEDPRLWTEAGGVLFRAGVRRADGETFARAARYFERAVELDPQEARYRFNLACAQDWGGRAAAAEASYERALELRPGYLEAYENLVLLLRGQERMEDARAAQQQMLRQPLTPEELERVLAAIEG
jgi:tetratricopeptide (TPR) repeat protein